MLFFASLSNAQIVYNNNFELIPEYYIFDQPTDTGSYDYHDETGEQLIDGVYGSNTYWFRDLGQGVGYEWLGWVLKPTVNIDFDFGQSITINGIHVRSTQDNVGDVVLPNVKIFAKKIMFGNMLVK